MKSVYEAALMLEVIAGDDPRDAQWVRGPINVDSYTDSIGTDNYKFKIGIVKDSLLEEAIESDVLESFQQSIKTLTKLGFKAFRYKKVKTPKTKKTIKLNTRNFLKIELEL